MVQRLCVLIPLVLLLTGKCLGDSLLKDFELANQFGSPWEFGYYEWRDEDLEYNSMIYDSGTSNWKISDDYLSSISATEITPHIIGADDGYYKRMRTALRFIDGFERYYFWNINGTVRMRDPLGSCSDPNADGVEFRLFSKAWNDYIETFQSIHIDSGDTTEKYFDFDIGSLTSRASHFLYVDANQNDNCDAIVVTAEIYKSYNFNGVSNTTLLDTFPPVSATPTPIQKFNYGYLTNPDIPLIWNFNPFTEYEAVNLRWGTLSSRNSVNGSGVVTPHILGMFFSNLFPFLYVLFPDCPGDSPTDNLHIVGVRPTVIRWNPRTSGRFTLKIAFHKQASCGDGISVRLVEGETVILREIFVSGTNTSSIVIQDLVEARFGTPLDFVIDPAYNPYPPYSELCDSVLIEKLSFESSCTFNFIPRQSNFRFDDWGPAQQPPAPVRTDIGVNWQIDSDGEGSGVLGLGNSSPAAFFPAPEPSAYGTWQFSITNRGTDDDYIGFALGLRLPMFQPNTSYIIMRWDNAESTPSRTPGLYFEIWRTKADPTKNPNRLLNERVLEGAWQDRVYFNVTNDFTVEYSNSSIQVWSERIRTFYNTSSKAAYEPVVSLSFEDYKQIFSPYNETSFPDGHFAFYQLSQSHVYFHDYSSAVVTTVPGCPESEFEFQREFNTFGCSASELSEIVGAMKWGGRLGTDSLDIEFGVDGDPQRGFASLKRYLFDEGVYSPLMCLSQPSNSLSEVCTSINVYSLLPLAVQVEKGFADAVCEKNVSPCGDDGFAEAIVDGGKGGYSYVWFSENGDQVGSAKTVNGLSAGSYTLKVTDASGCFYEVDFTLDQSPEIGVYFSSYDPCTKTANASVTSCLNEPYVLQWTDLGQNGSSITGIEPFVPYNLTIDTVFGCSIYTVVELGDIFGLECLIPSPTVTPVPIPSPTSIPTPSPSPMPDDPGDPVVPTTDIDPIPTQTPEPIITIRPDVTIPSPSPTVCDNSTEIGRITCAIVEIVTETDGGPDIIEIISIVNGTPILVGTIEIDEPPGTIITVVPSTVQLTSFKSPIFDITFKNTKGDIVQPTNDLEICFRDINYDVDDVCLGFIEEPSGRPLCEDRCLDRNGDEVCGKTPHLTSFGVLLGGAGDSGTVNECDSYDGDWITGDYYGDLILVAATFVSIVGCCALLAICTVYNPFLRRAMYGKEGSRVRSLRKITPKDKPLVDRELV